MDEKFGWDLARLLRFFQPIPVLITCKSLDSSFGVYQHALASHFSQSQLVWKRNGKSFPYRIAFPLKFVAYDDNYCWSNELTYTELTEKAYVHLFFINAASVEEYRSAVRHNVSEWFAKMTSRSDLQWLIVCDSTRSKEKKNRTTLMEKLKADFSRHQNRIIEVSESVEHGSFNSLVQAVQNSLVSHLDILMNVWDEHISNSRDSCSSGRWSLKEHYCSVMEYARVFWSFGALEYSLSVYDDLDRFLLQIVLDSGDSSHEWVRHMRATPLKMCPTLSYTLSKVASLVNEDFSFIEMRHFLVSQQILLCLYLNNSRTKAKSAAPSLRSDFAGLILKYAQHALQISTEHCSVLEIKESEAKIACWTLFLVGEALHISRLLAGAASIEEALAPALCFLHSYRFHALLLLDEHFSDEKLIGWLENSQLDDKFLIETLQNRNIYSSQLQKIHDTTNSTLIQCGRKRMATQIGGLFAQWLRKHSNQQAALPHQLRYLTQLLESGCTSQSFVDEVKEVMVHSEVYARRIPTNFGLTAPLAQVWVHLEKSEDHERLLHYMLFVSINDKDEKIREVYRKSFIETASGKPNTKIWWPIDGFSNFDVEITNFSSHVQLPAGVFSMSLNIKNSFSTDLKDCQVVVSMREIDSGLMSRNKNPIFQVNFSQRDNISRILSPHRGHVFDRALPASPSTSTFTVNKQLDLLQGDNLLSVSTPLHDRGIFILEKIELTFLNDSLSITFDQAAKIHPVVVFVQSTPHNLVIHETGKDYLAGVVQYIEVEMEAGSATSESQLFVKTTEDVKTEFLDKDGTWKNSLVVDIKAMELCDKCIVRIAICVPMDSTMTSSPAVKKINFQLEWLHRTWSFDLPFVALFILSSKRSLLENKMIYELEIARALAEDWTVVLEKALLEAEAMNDEKSLSATLLNPEFTDLVPNSYFSLVWSLPKQSDVSLKHMLNLTYRVKPSKELNNALNVDRSYVYSSEFDLQVPRIGYELCTQMLSHQPGAQLCRAGNPCDLVVSLRSLRSAVELLYVVLDADVNLWVLNDRAKVITVKESGLGQIAFSVVPCAAGFLPYPSVSLYSCVQLGPRNVDAGWMEGADMVPGAPLLSFQRTAGKQIRVLAASHVESQVTERKAGFKQKIVQLFD